MKAEVGRFQVLADILLLHQVSWDVTLCRWVNESRTFDGS